MAERERFDDPALPPPGSRSGDGTASILPYLLKSLATRPQVPVVLDPTHSRMDALRPKADTMRLPGDAPGAP
jgi:hypothetical protein